MLCSIQRHANRSIVLPSLYLVLRIFKLLVWSLLQVLTSTEHIRWALPASLSLTRGSLEVEGHKRIKATKAIHNSTCEKQKPWKTSFLLPSPSLRPPHSASLLVHFTRHIPDGICSSNGSLSLSSPEGLDSSMQGFLGCVWVFYNCKP